MEQRPVPTINVVTRSGATTEVKNKEKQPAEAWVRKAPKKILAFDIEREKETFTEAKRDFAAPSTSVAPAQQHQQQSQPQEASTDKVSTLSSFFTELSEAPPKSECFKRVAESYCFLQTSA